MVADPASSVAGTINPERSTNSDGVTVGGGVELQRYGCNE